MRVCICNNLDEEQIKKLSWEEYEEIKNCGICEETVKEILDEKP
jgi:bacterioferritin-associated ferredoxin